MTLANRRALQSAIEANSVDLLSYLRRRVGTEEAPDLLGETFVVAWRRIEDLPLEPEQGRMWMFGIARGVLLNHRRGQQRRWALADRLREQIPLAQTSPAADESLEVRDAISRLDPDLGEIVQLVHWERLTVAQAAEVMGIPASTARGRYQRAKELLRVALDTAPVS